ncbi:hypothetical protein Pcinc_024079 [Petrolisthes cinctipes]|uniref:Uncharacterized protein n=1 Tax=Petrolisthes cinctipes TaxID=88211 RepID=A0AAE1KDI5_PETCI|nr:hypothetical protein Pcinc_024079 [Petrolisthes cinctipes]
MGVAEDECVGEWVCWRIGVLRDGCVGLVCQQMGVLEDGCVGGWGKGVKDLVGEEDVFVARVWREKSVVKEGCGRGGGGVAGVEVCGRGGGSVAEEEGVWQRRRECGRGGGSVAEEEGVWQRRRGCGRGGALHLRPTRSMFFICLFLLRTQHLSPLIPVPSCYLPAPAIDILPLAYPAPVTSQPCTPPVNLPAPVTSHPCTPPVNPLPLLPLIPVPLL